MSDDQTKNNLKTQPTLETVLERVNAVADSIGNLRTEMNQRFEAVDNQIAGLRKDVERGFRTFERKLGYLANDLILQRRAEQDEIFERIEALENKAS